MKKNLFLIIFIFIITLVAIIPVISVFINAFVDPGQASLLGGGAAKILFKPFPVSIKQFYSALFLNRETIIFFWNSVRISLPILFGGIIIALPSGYALAKFTFPFKRTMFFCYVLVMLLPIQISLVGTYILFDYFDLLGKFISVILPGIFSPFGAFLLYQYIKTVPDETIESARIDGAGEVRILLGIVAPQVKAGITAMLLLILIDCWNMVEMPITLLKEERLYPMSIMIRYITINNPAVVFASVALFSLPLIILFFMAQEHLTEGIGRSVLK